MDKTELDSDARTDFVFNRISRETAERRTKLRDEEHKLEDARHMLRILRQRKRVTQEVRILLELNPHLQRDFRELLDTLQAD